MEKQKMFLAGDTVIDLGKVMDVAHPPNSSGLSDEEVWVMVMLEDGRFTTIKSRADVEAFTKAMDEHMKASADSTS